MSMPIWSQSYRHHYVFNSLITITWRTYIHNLRQVKCSPLHDQTNMLKFAPAPLTMLCRRMLLELYTPPSERHHWPYSRTVCRRSCICRGDDDLCLPPFPSPRETMLPLLALTHLSNCILSSPHCACGSKQHGRHLTHFTYSQQRANLRFVWYLILYGAEAGSKCVCVLCVFIQREWFHCWRHEREVDAWRCKCSGNVQ